MSFNNVLKLLTQLLTGTPQSQFAAVAIIVALLSLGLSILFNQTDLSVSERLGLIGTIVLFSLPSIIFALVDLTCISGKTTENSFCWIYGWIISLVIIVMCVIVVFSSLTSMMTYNSAATKTVSPVVEEEEANKMADEMLNSMPETQTPKNDTPLVEDNVENMYGDTSMSSLGMMEGFADKKKEKKDIYEGFISGGEYASFE